MYYECIIKFNIYNDIKCMYAYMIGLGGTHTILKESGAGETLKLNNVILQGYCIPLNMRLADQAEKSITDVIQLIRIKRAKWLKMNLTYNSKSLVVQVLRRQSLHNRTKGDVFSDMPNFICTLRCT